MKKNKLTKLALALGTVATIAAPIAAVVSCGSSTDFSKKVVIKTTWAASGSQIKALKSVAAAYNAQKEKDDFEVVIQHVEGGYGKALDNDIKDIKIGHMGSVADAYIDYPDSIGKLENVKGKDYSLDFSTLDAGNGIRDSFEPSFVNFNDQIGEAPVVGKSLFAAPLASSTDMMTVDLPLLGKFLEDGFVTPVTSDKGLIKKANDAWNNAKKAGGDSAEINKLWGTPSDSKIINSSLVVDEDTFKSYDKLFLFGQAVQKAFGKDNKSASPHIIGSDAPTNMIYNMIYSDTGADINKFIFSSSENKFLNKPAGPEEQLFEKAADKISNAVKDGALVLNGGGAYSSTDLVAHRLAIAIGSTAGFSHNYVSNGEMALDIDGTKIPFGKYDKQLKTTTKDGALLATDDKYGNPLVKSGTAPYSIVLDNEADASKIESLKNIKGVHIWYVGDLNGLDASKAISAKNYDSKGNAHPGFIIGSAKGTFSDNDPKQLNFNEAGFVPAPELSGKAGKAEALLQGPSIIGVKHGGKKDEQLAKFVKFLFDKNNKVEGGTSSIIEGFDHDSQYITPFIGAFKGKNTWSLDKSGGNKMTYDIFKRVTDENDPIALFNNPISGSSKAIREQIDTTLRETLYKGISQGQKSTMSGEAIYNSVKAALALDQIK